MHYICWGRYENVTISNKELGLKNFLERKTRKGKKPERKWWKDKTNLKSQKTLGIFLSQ